MDEKTPKRRRKWLWILCGIVFGVPAVIVLILMVMMQTHRLRPDQMQSPRFLTVKPTETSATVARFDPAKHLAYPDYFEQSNGKDAAALYRKLEKTTDNPEWRNACPFLARKAGEPLTAEQDLWLKEHRAEVEEMIQFAKLSNKPTLTWEEALALKRNIPVANMMLYTTCARVLTAEARRLKDAGDWASASNVLTSINPMAQAMQQPWLIGHLVGVSMQGAANKELGSWISKGDVPTDVARTLQEGMNQQVIGFADYRKAIETEYATGRNHVVELLNSSVPDIIRQTVRGSKSASLSQLFWDHPGRFLATGAVGTLAKANASTIVDRFDALNSERFAALDKGERFDWNSDAMKILNLPYSPKFPISNFDEAHTRTDTGVTILKLNIAGLNIAQGKPAGGTDPFGNQPLKTADEGGATVLYSVGPDKQDDGGAISYDPTNGTVSRGDIFLRVPRR